MMKVTPLHIGLFFLSNLVTTILVNLIRYIYQFFILELNNTKTFYRIFYTWIISCEKRLKILMHLINNINCYLTDTKVHFSFKTTKWKVLPKKEVWIRFYEKFIFTYKIKVVPIILKDFYFINNLFSIFEIE